MRKVLSFVLVLALVLGSFSMAFAATPTDVVGTPNSQAVQVLMGLGVVNGYADGSFKPANIVTRAEMAKLIVVALGLQDYATGTSKFADMAGAAWAQGYVNYAAGLGIIKGYPDGTFKPSQTVSYVEAAAMIVRALGYTDASLLPATWPANYVVKAKALGIFDDVSKASALGASRGDIAQMLYNTLTVKMVSTDSENKTTALDPIDNMLIRLGATLNADTTKNVASVVMGTEDTQINLVPYIGVYADKYTNSDGDIIAIDPISDVIVGDYTANVGTTGAGIFNTSTADDTDYNISADVASASIPFFWNGVQEPVNSHHSKYSVDTTSSATHRAVLNADLNGKRIDTAYSTAFWVATSDALFSTDDAADIADNQSLLGNDFILDSNDNIDMNSFSLMGAASLKDIKTDNVVYVYNGWGTAGIKKIEVGTKTVTGEVTDVSSDGLTFTIAGTDYDISDYAASTPEVGDTGTARLDYAGDIYDWTVSNSSTGNYALVIDYSTTTVTAFNAQKVELMTKDGTDSTFELDDATVATFGVGHITYGDLVTYSVNKDGVIDEMTNVPVHALTTPTDVSVSGSIVDNKTIDPAAVVFTVSGTTVAARGITSTYDVATLADIKDTTLVGAYYTYDGESKIQVLIVRAQDAGNANSYAVINTTGTSINADGDKVIKVSGFMNGKAFTAKTTHDLFGSSKFALVFNHPELFDLSINAAGVITDAVQLNSVTKSVTDALANVNGIVADKDGSTLVKVGTDWYTISSNAVVYQLNTADGEYVLKTISAVRNPADITMWQVNTDNDGYDVIVISNPSRI
ncbi:MAG: S-layer homology domain-containing protein [Eubacteriales bacterium]